MNKKRFSIWIAAAFLFISGVETPAQKTLSANEVMQKVAEKLASVNVLGYKYKFEFAYPSQQRSLEVSAQAYLDLRPVDRTADFKYQFLSDDRLSVYNGAESFIADKKSGKLLVDNKPSFDRDGIILLMNSPLTLKYALPKLIADSAIHKKLSITKVGTSDCYVVDFAMPKAAINAIGNIYESRVEQAGVYHLTIDKTTFLPIEVLRTNDKNDESFKVSFSELTENPAKPDDLSWYYSTYAGNYHLETPKELVLVKRGQPAPNFKLNTYNSADSISLDQFKGRLVLVEFWIVNCGFCIAAVPKLNALMDEFRDKGVEFVAINAHDTAKTIDLFKDNNKPKYRILSGGESTAETYGTDAFPTFVLIGKDGKVVYSRAGLVEKELESAISSNL